MTQYTSMCFRNYMTSKIQMPRPTAPTRSTINMIVERVGAAAAQDVVQMYHVLSSYSSAALKIPYGS